MEWFYGCALLFQQLPENLIKKSNLAEL